MDIVKYLISASRHLDLLLLLRYTYRVGNPLITDELYDKFEQILRNLNNEEINNLLDTNYDDDPVPYALLLEFGIDIDDEDVLEDVDIKYNYAHHLREDKSRSINSKYTIESSIEYFVERRENKQNICMSLKVDGLFNKILYSSGNFYIDLSRGRAEHSQCLDYSYGARKVLPPCVNTDIEFLKLAGESYVDEDYLETLQCLRPTKYKTPKGASKSLLVTPHSEHHYDHLHILIHNIDGVGNTYSEMFQTAEALGFKTVPNKLVKWESIPENPNDIADWIISEMVYFEKYIDIPSDGVCVMVDDKNANYELVGKYSTNEIALKFGYWKALKYTGIVTDIKVKQCRVDRSVVVTIEPIVAKDRATLSRIDCHDPAILIENDIKVGSQIIFERDSGAMSKLIRKR